MKLTTGSSAACTMRKLPIMMPSGMAMMDDRKKPRLMTTRLDQAFFRSEPSISVFQKAGATWCGGGQKVVSTSPP